VLHSQLNKFGWRLRWALVLILLDGVWTYAAGPTPLVPPNSNPTFTFSQFSSGSPIRFIAYGDMRFTNPTVTDGTNPRIRKWLAQRVAEEHPQVVLLTGDTPFTGGSDADWQDFQDETLAWRSQGILTLPTLGNHESYGGFQQGIANYLKNFPQIEGHRYYSALLGDVEIISLDCTSGASASTLQGEWFAAQLGHLPRQVQFLFILYHIPWVADRQSQVFVNLPSKEALNLRGILEAHLVQLHARVVVLNGHIHNYERFERYRVEYVVTGGGGAEPYPLVYRGHSDLYRDPGFPVYHYLTIEVSNRQLHAKMWKVKDPNAPELTVEAKDEFTLEAPPWNPAPSPSLQPAAQPAPQ
jgi:hypothetical protein